MNATQILERVAMVPEAGCWIWLGATNGKDYGQTRHQGKAIAAHRLSYMLFRGPIPEGLWVLHRCDVPACINPAHLFLGDRVANMVDCARKGRIGMQRHPERSSFCRPEARLFYPRGEKHGSAKLTTEVVLEIKKRLASGELCYRLAAEYGVHKGTISHIKQGDTWSHLTTV